MTIPYDEFFRRANAFITDRDREWCGIPTPIPGKGLVLESKHPHAERTAQLQAIVDEQYTETVPPENAPEEEDGLTIVNQWYGRTKLGANGHILIVQDRHGRRHAAFDPDLVTRNRLLLGGLETLDAWHLDTELTAIELLSTLLTERMFKAYVLTGTFLETSKRSGLTYLFRRLRPTVVLTPRSDRVYDDVPAHEMRILTCLCLHPLGYYEGTMCGAMVPTDDIIAHLLMMRGDEHLFWKRANHHHPGTARSGLCL